MAKHTSNKKLARELHGIKGALLMRNTKKSIFDDIEKRLARIENQLTDQTEIVRKVSGLLQ